MQPDRDHFRRGAYIGRMLRVLTTREKTSFPPLTGNTSARRTSLDEKRSFRRSETAIRQVGTRTPQSFSPPPTPHPPHPTPLGKCRAATSTPSGGRPQTCGENLIAETQKIRSAGRPTSKYRNTFTTLSTFVKVARSHVLRRAKVSPVSVYTRGAARRVTGIFLSLSVSIARMQFTVSPLRALLASLAR